MKRYIKLFSICIVLLLLCTGCKTANKEADISGTWLDDQYLLSHPDNNLYITSDTIIQEDDKYTYFVKGNKIYITVVKSWYGEPGDKYETEFEVNDTNLIIENGDVPFDNGVHIWWKSK